MNKYNDSFIVLCSLIHNRFFSFYGHVINTFLFIIPITKHYSLIQIVYHYIIFFLNYLLKVVRRGSETQI